MGKCMCVVHRLYEVQSLELVSRDRPNPISAEPNQTNFLPNYSSAYRTMSAKKAQHVGQMRQISAKGSVRFLLNFLGFG